MGKDGTRDAGADKRLPERRHLLARHSSLLHCSCNSTPFFFLLCGRAAPSAYQTVKGFNLTEGKTRGERCVSTRDNAEAVGGAARRHVGPPQKRGNSEKKKAKRKELKKEREGELPRQREEDARKRRRRQDEKNGNIKKKEESAARGGWREGREGGGRRTQRPRTTGTNITLGYPEKHAREEKEKEKVMSSLN